MEIRLEDAGYRLYSGRSDVLEVTVLIGMFSDGLEALICQRKDVSPELDTQKGAAADMACSCGSCKLKASVTPQDPKFDAGAPAAVRSTSQVVREAFKVVSLAAIVGMPVSPSSAAGVAKLSIITRMCPESGTVKLDMTVNPLGLEMGDRTRMREVNGALVGSIVIQAALLLCSVGIMTYMARRLDFFRVEERRFERCLVTEGDDEESHSTADDASDASRGGVEVKQRLPSMWVRVMHQGATKDDLVYLCARARFGWIFIPATFLYPGATFSSMSALMYSTPLFQVIAVCDLLVFMFGMGAYATRVARHTKFHTEVEPIPEDPSRGFLSKFFWGYAEWVPKVGHGNGAWVELNHLLYDGYKRSMRYWLSYELFITFLIAAVGAWNPPSVALCEIKAWSLLAVLGIFFLSLLILRPYLGGYENVFETAIAGVDVAIAALVAIATKQDRPEDHWSTKVGAYLVMAVLWLIVTKALMDMTVFILDERAVWKIVQERLPPSERRGFLLHLMCCGDNIPDDPLEDYVVHKERVEQEELGSLVDLDAQEWNFDDDDDDDDDGDGESPAASRASSQAESGGDNFFTPFKGNTGRRGTTSIPLLGEDSVADTSGSRCSAANNSYEQQPLPVESGEGSLSNVPLFGAKSRFGQVGAGRGKLTTIRAGERRLGRRGSTASTGSSYTAADIVQSAVKMPISPPASRSRRNRKRSDSKVLEEVSNSPPSSDGSEKDRFIVL